MLLNLVIAILSNTFNELNKYSLGLYYDSLVKAIQQRRPNSYYGAFTCAYLIFSPVMLALTPIYLCFKPRSKHLKMFNNWVQMVFYFPIMIILLLVFFMTNLVLLPFAYIVAIINKILLIMRYNHLSSHPTLMITDLITFVITGLLSLLLI